MANFTLRGESAIISLLFFLAPCITLLAPLTTVPALILLSGGCVGIALVHGQSPRELFRFDLGLAVFAAVTLYLLINSAWSLDPSRALGKVLWFGLIVVMTFGASRALCRWNEHQIRRAVIAFLAGMSVGLAFILFELATDNGLTRLLFNSLPMTRSDSFKTMTLEGGQIVKIAAFELNRNVAVMLLMLWPALLCLNRLADRRWRAFSMGALLAAAAVAIMFSEHETSKLGLVAGAAIFLAAWLWPTPIQRALLVAWCLAFALVVPLATLAVKEDLHHATWLPYSAKSRVVLWAYTAEKIPEAPFFGIGLNSARKLSADRTIIYRQEVLADSEGSEKRVLVWKPGPHSHNEFLQSWYELGAVGAILLLAAGSVVIWHIGRLPPATQPFIFAQFTSFFVVAAFSWGMWQSWLMAVTGLAAIYAALAASLASAEREVADAVARKFAPAKPQLTLGERPA